MQHTIPPGQPPIKLADYLPRALGGQPAWAIREMLEKRQIKRDGARLLPTDIVRGGESLTLYLPKAALDKGARQTPPDIAYEDARVLIAIKPQGIASQQADDPKGQPGLLELLQAREDERGGATLRLCHRLDHHTGGLLLVAKDDAAEAALRAAFHDHRIEKTYMCRVWGTPEPREATLRAYLRKDADAARAVVRDAPFAGALAITTRYRVVTPGEGSLLEVGLVTGRTHQIRAHLAHIGHPIVGDDKYGDRAANKRLGVVRQQLWATRLTLRLDGELAALDGLTVTCDAPFDTK